MKKNLIIPILIVLVAAIVALLWFSMHQKHQMTEMVEQLEFEKEELQDEYEDLAIEFDGYQNLDIQNDSLQDRLAHEQQRVRDLLEELRITKVTNARRIAELKKELATVRSVMVGYIHQIDSLNRTNARLVEENEQYRAVNEQVIQENTEVKRQNTELQETVTRAAMLEMTDFKLTTLNKRDRKTTLFSQIQKLQFDYTLSKNITCERGMKHIYLVLRRPDGEVMQKNSLNTFEFEGRQVQYSVRQDIEYEGEECSFTMYWPVDEILMPGTYNADFIVDGNLIGSYPFALKK